MSNIQSIRDDDAGQHRTTYERNKKKIFATETLCGICHRPVDFSAKFPAPLSPTIDHIIPISRGGHPSDIGNLQLAHFACNRAKSDKLMKDTPHAGDEQTIISNRVLPQTIDWSAYRTP